MARNDRVARIDRGVSGPSDHGPDGVASVAIQGRSKRLEERDERVEERAGQIDDLEDENAELRERLTAVETYLDVTPREPASESQEVGADV